MNNDAGAPTILIIMEETCHDGGVGRDQITTTISVDALPNRACSGLLPGSTAPISSKLRLKGFPERNHEFVVPFLKYPLLN